MGTTLTGTTPANTYDSLIKVTDNGPLSGSLKTLTDGLGNDSTLSLSTAAASIAGTLAVTGATTLSSTLTGSGDVTLQGGATRNLRFLDSTNTNLNAQIQYDQTASNSGQLFFGTNNAGTFDTRLTITSAGNVGIGTSAPQSNLQVLGTIKVATGNAQGILGLGEANGTSINVGIWRGSANAPTTDGNFLNLGGYDGIVFAAGNAVIGSQTEAMRITSAGNVGIGTTTSSYDTNKIGSGHRFLNVQAGSSLYAVGTLAGNQSGNGDRLGYLTFVNDNNSASYKYSAWIGSEVDGTTTNQQGGRLIFSTMGDGSSAGPIERMRITSDGNVGIGTSAPDVTLTLGSNTVTDNSIGIKLFRGASTNQYTELKYSGNFVTNAIGNDIVMQREGTEVARFTAEGLCFGGDYLAANALSDYETGTFTPTLATGYSTAPSSYTQQAGRYTKIGDVVYYLIDIDPDGAVADSSALQIGGLPFTVSASNPAGGGYITYQTGFNTNASDSLHIGTSGTTILFTDTSGNGREGNAAGVNINSRVFISGFYKV